MDGLRAIAVLAVLGYHADLLPGGYLGVDCFLVLSGFLITCLLLQERERHGLISLRAFWVRRAFRLLPASVVYLAVGTLLVLAFRGPTERNDFAGTAGSAMAYANNWWRVLRPDSGGSWGGHLWSLSVEEQFYLVWPLALVTMLKTRWSHRRLLLVVCAFVAAVDAWRVVLLTAGAGPMRVYFGTDTRGDALAVGCALAICWRAGMLSSVRRVHWTRLSWAAWVALAAAACFSPKLSDPSPTYLSWGGFTAVALAAAVAVGAAVCAPDHGFARVLAFRPLVALGGISYGFYLWHYPIISTLHAHAERGWTRYAAALVAALVSTAAAAGSRSIIERPASRLCPSWARVPSTKRDSYPRIPRPNSPASRRFRPDYEPLHAAGSKRLPTQGSAVVCAEPVNAASEDPNPMRNPVA